MSWDVLIEPGTEPIGTVGEARKKITAVLPAVDWSDGAMGTLNQDALNLEFALVAADEELDARAMLDAFSIAVMGAANPLPVLAQLCGACGWTAVEAHTRCVIDMGNSLNERWRLLQAPREPPGASGPTAPAPRRGFWRRLFGRS